MRLTLTKNALIGLYNGDRLQKTNLYSGDEMTRDTQDDLLILYQLLNEYILFLDNRIDLQIEEVEKSFSKLNLDLLSTENAEYVVQAYKRHREESLDFKNTLVIMKRIIISLWSKYPNAIRFYSRKEYTKNLQDHKKMIEEILYQLGKYG